MRKPLNPAAQRLAELCLAMGLIPTDITAPNTVIMDGNSIGEGLVLSPFSALASNVRIGRFFHVNVYAVVGHDCSIGDYVTLGPRVCCSGNVTLEDHVYLGAHAVIKRGRRGRPLVVGENAVVGMGAVVTKDVEPSTVMVGNPARILKRL